MTRVDFYVVSRSEPDAVLSTACRLAEKAFHLKNRVFINAASRDQAVALDQLLWTFRDDSFVPHGRAGAGSDRDDPVSIGSGETPDAPFDVLINLGDDVPLWAKESPRIAEIVGADPQSRAAGRKRYRHYRDEGYEPGSHTL
jgi:DNA polymerase-3 subunit chi